VFDTLAAKLSEFKTAGAGTIVDATGMFEGRDLRGQRRHGGAAPGPP
jgi:phosphotriesterase-related protein